MPVRIVRLGSPRRQDEGLRLGTVRRPPRGVPKAEFASRDYYDVWFPTLAPSVATMNLGRAATTRQEWHAFTAAYRRELASPEARHALNLIAALSHTARLSVGCYCEDAARCHRSVLRALLEAHGASVEP